MVRWEPDSRGRLEQAALALFGERGFEDTTVAQIAERAGVTERTFFRHYADKREVLFGGAGVLETALTSAVAGAAESSPPLDAVLVGLDSVASLLEQRREFARRRQAIIAANPELQERELIKLASLVTAIAGVLSERGVPEPAASLTAEAGIAAFRVGFERWVAGPDDADLAALIRDSLDQLRAVTAPAAG